MSKILCALLLTVSLLLACIPQARATARDVRDAPPSLSAVSAVLTDEDGQILAAKDAHRRMGPASTTKIMTALLVLESCGPEEEIVIPAEAVGIEGSSVYLCEGEVLTVKQLLYALLLASANDAATALALHVSGSVADFAARMNERARALGLSDTHFENPHGLASENHYTSAYDLALIAAEALREPLFREIVASRRATIPLGTDETRVLVNHNKLLRMYDGAIGVKTGYTRATGRTLVSAAERDGLCLIAVTLDAADDWNDHRALLDYGFSTYRRVVLCERGDILSTLPVTGGVEEYVSLTAAESLSLTLPKEIAKEPALCIEVTWRFLFAPVTRGHVVGRAIYRLGDADYPVPLTAGADIAAYKPPQMTPWERLLHFFSPD